MLRGAAPKAASKTASLRHPAPVLVHQRAAGWFASSARFQARVSNTDSTQLPWPASNPQLTSFSSSTLQSHFTEATKLNLAWSPATCHRQHHTFTMPPPDSSRINAELCVFFFCSASERYSSNLSTAHERFLNFLGQVLTVRRQSRFHLWRLWRTNRRARVI
jgi:hypothetical protein